MGIRLPRSGLLLVLLLLGCASNEQWEWNRAALDYGLKELPEGDLSIVASRMNRLLSETQEDPADFALQRFYAEYVLTQVHTAGSLARPFLSETTTQGNSVGGIGQRPENDPTQRPSINGHLVASVYHASMARSMYDRAARSGPKHEGITLIPDSLWRTGVDNADANLQTIQTTAYHRLGFYREVDKILDRSQDLTQVESCLRFMDQYQIQEELRPWLCEMISRYLRSRDEREAFRFAILAIEGRERFGYALPAATVAAVEDWILNGASVKFVCPESQTEYISGERRSPISGIPHIDYITVPREE